MMAYERSESTRDNFGKIVHQFQPETKTKTHIRKLESILIKLYRQNVSLSYLPTPLLGQDMTQGQFSAEFDRFEFRVFLLID